MSYRDQKNRLFAGAVRREEFRHLIIEECQAGGAQTLGVGAQVHPASQDSGFELDRTIPAISHHLLAWLKVGQEEYRGCCVASQILFQREVGGTIAEIAVPQSHQ